MALLKLRYRNSFIDADDDLMTAPKRASSLPALRAKRVSDTELEAEEASLESYVENLSHQLQAKTPMDLRSPSFAAGLSTSNTPASSSNSPEASSTFFLPNDPVESPAALDTPGSLGHPEVCRRQCIYFLQGHCSNGDDCTYCHLPHPQKAPKLDKRQRNIMQALSHQDLLALTLHLCKIKAEEIGMVKEAQKIIEILTSEAGSAPLPSISDRDNRALCKTLARMTLGFCQDTGLIQNTDFTRKNMFLSLSIYIYTYAYMYVCEYVSGSVYLCVISRTEG
eukprot:Skav216365  [mRNA]  locus=scaffold1517:89477:91302:+ [translate_table: standard]